MDHNNSGLPIPVGGAPSAYTNQYDQYAYESNPQTEKSQQDKLKEKARKWQQLQNKRYGEKRKFGMYYTIIHYGCSPTDIFFSLK